jgi:hypothetical protein
MFAQHKVSTYVSTQVVEKEKGLNCNPAKTLFSLIAG